MRYEHTEELKQAMTLEVLRAQWARANPADYIAEPRKAVELLRGVRPLIESAANAAKSGNRDLIAAEKTNLRAYRTTVDYWRYPDSWRYSRTPDSLHISYDILTDSINAIDWLL